jgi:hypothetical protein
MHERPKLLSRNPTKQIVERNPPSHEPTVARIGKRQQTSRMLSSAIEQGDVIRIATGRG